MTRNSVDVTSPKVVRSTAGSLFHLPVVTGLDAEATVVALEARGIRPPTEGGAATRLPDVDLLTPRVGDGNGGDRFAARARRPLHRPHLHPRPRAWLSPQSAMAATICLGYASATASH